MSRRTFIVWRVDSNPDFDGDEIDAIDAEQAVELWAEADDIGSAEYAIVSQRDAPDVYVKNMATGEITKWHVEGEAVPSYRAYRR